MRNTVGKIILALKICYLTSATFIKIDKTVLRNSATSTAFKCFFSKSSGFGETVDLSRPWFSPNQSQKEEEEKEEEKRQLGFKANITQRQQLCSQAQLCCRTHTLTNIFGPFPSFVGFCGTQ